MLLVHLGGAEVYWKFKLIKFGVVFGPAGSFFFFLVMQNNTWECDRKYLDNG